MASGWFNISKGALFGGSLNLTTDTLRVMLMGSGYTPNPDSSFVSQISSAEATGTGYVGGFGGSGRKLLVNPVVTTNTAQDRAELSFDTVTWSTVSVGVVQYVVVLKPGTSDADSTLVAWLHFVPAATSGADLRLVSSSAGMLQLV